MALSIGLTGLAVALAACGSAITEPADEAVALEIKPAAVSLVVGESVTLVAVARSAADQAVDGETTWTSSDPQVVTVAADGTLTAASAGTATVEAEFRGKGKARGRLKKGAPVTVTDPPAEDPPADDPPAEDPPAEDPPAEDPPADEPVPQADIPFGASRYDITVEYPFNAALYHRVHAGREEEELSPLRTYGKRASVNLVGGKSNYKNPDGSFNAEMWKAIVDEFDVAVIQRYVDEGIIVAHYLVDEPHAGGRWSGEDVDPALVDEIACHSKSLWPNLPTLVRTHPGWAVREEGAAHTFQCVDIWVAQYSARKGPIDEYVAQNVADAAALGAGLYGALNPITGGDGSSGVHSPYGDDWMMSADELRTYGAAWMGAPIVGFSMWNWGWGTNDNMSWYWLQPEIRAAMEYVAGL